MKKYNVYTHYDNCCRVIARIVPRDDWTISAATYRRLLNARVIGGDAGVYTDAPERIRVVDSNNNIIGFI